MLMCEQFYRAITNDVTEEYLATGEYVDDVRWKKAVYMQYVQCNPNCVFVHSNIT